MKRTPGIIKPIRSVSNSAILILNVKETPLRHDVKVLQSPVECT